MRTLRCICGHIWTTAIIGAPCPSCGGVNVTLIERR